MITKKYLLNKGNGSLSEDPSFGSCSAVVGNHWILQPLLSSVESGSATFRMMRDGDNMLGLNREGTEITGGEIIYWIQGIEYKKEALTLKWLPGAASEPEE